MIRGGGPADRFLQPGIQQGAVGQPGQGVVGGPPLGLGDVDAQLAVQGCMFMEGQILPQHHDQCDQGDSRHVTQQAQQLTGGGDAVTGPHLPGDQTETDQDGRVWAEEHGALFQNTLALAGAQHAPDGRHAEQRLTEGVAGVHHLIGQAIRLRQKHGVGHVADKIKQKPQIQPHDGGAGQADLCLEGDQDNQTDHQGILHRVAQVDQQAGQMFRLRHGVRICKMPEHHEHGHNHRDDVEQQARELQPGL